MEYSNKYKLFSFINKKFLPVYFMSLSILSFSIWGGKSGIIPCIIGVFLFFKNTSLNTNQILQDLHPLRWWLISFFGILTMAVISLLFCFSVLQTTVSIISFLFVPLLIFVSFFLVFKHSTRQEQYIGLVLFFSIFILHSICTIIEYFVNGNLRSVGIGDHPIIPYTIFLFIPFCLSLSLLIYSHHKFLAFTLMFLSLFAIHCNGTRASFLSIGSIFFASIFYPQYKYKKILAPLFLLLLLLLTFFLIQWSSHQNTRFNFKHMIEKAGIVWTYAPAEMGRFDVQCFSKTTYKCSIESGNQLDYRFSFESNALQRLSLNKMAIELIKDNPFRPNGFFPLFFDLNIPQEIQSQNLHYVKNHNGLRYSQHIQNGFLSAFFELGIIGGFLYLILFVLLIFHCLKHRGLFGFILFSWIIGFIPQNLLDVPLGFGGIVLVFFSGIGIFLGVMCETKNDNNI